MAKPPRLTIRDLRARAVCVPMRLPLETGGGTITIAPLALIDLLTEEGVTGSAYLFCYAPPATPPRTAASWRASCCSRRRGWAWPARSRSWAR